MPTLRDIAVGSSYVTPSAGVRRSLAAELKLDYSVLSVAFLTLGLILFVEILRHRIDRRAQGRPFAKTVLESVYRELSTLGIVEFAIFLGHSYAPNFDLKVEAVFAKVHFLLFFTAIINALMSVLLAFFASRISHKMWVKTEELELNHYIAIREEFTRVEQLLGQYEIPPDDVDAERAHRLSWKCLWSGWKRIRQSVRYPMLRRQYDSLLVQVRFHELRVHFLKANNLPLKFHVSDYLVKSELHVFKKCVHISTLAWIMVAAAVNLCYFLMGIVAFVSESSLVVGTTMSYIFIGACISFVPISYLIFNKMRWIFGQIMKKRLIDAEPLADVGDSETKSRVQDEHSLGDDVTAEMHPRREESKALSNRSSSSRGQEKILNQLDLFWFDDPAYIIGALQFMQLCYSIAASILLIFWESINVSYAKLGAAAFVVSLASCYCVFLYIMAQVVPRYTLCTSLGQLVNRRRLHEALAKFKLDEARKKRRHALEEKRIVSSLRQGSSGKVETVGVSGLPLEKNVPQHSHFQSEEADKTEHQSFASNGPIRPVQSYKREISTDRQSDSSHEAERMTKLAALVMTDTDALPVGETLSDIRKQRRKRRMKSVSDGVQFMRSMGISDAAATILGEDDSKKVPPVPVENPKTNAGIDSETLISPGVRIMSGGTKRGRRRAGKLQKSVSANAALKSPASALFAANADGPDLESGGTSKNVTFVKRRNSDEGRKAVGMPILIEGIPARTVKPAELPIAVGRMHAVDRGETSQPASNTESAHPNLNVIVEDANLIEESGAESDQTRRSVKFFHPISANLRGDDDTINTDESEGGQSDYDDFPEVAESVKSNKLVEESTMPRILAKDFELEKILRSQRYRLISVVFGTMLVFFIVGMRVDAFLLSNGTIADNGNTFQLPLRVSFWWEVAWLAIFIFIDLVSICIFRPHKGSSDKYENLHLLVASVSDVILSALCLSLLLWAEARRCCSQDSQSRLLAAPAEDYGRTSSIAEISVKGDGGAEECCESFGRRTYGGLGNIEPFTSMIAFRVLRFSFGRFIRNLILRCAEKDGNLRTNQTTSVRNLRKDRAREYRNRTSTLARMERQLSSHESSNKVLDKELKTFEYEEGTIVDLWLKAINLYPDVAEQYGEFSGELLQAMLGIAIVAEQTKIKDTTDQTSSGAAPTGALEKMSPSVPKVGPTPTPQSGTSTAEELIRGNNPLAPFTVSKRFSGLDSDAQGIILAGKIGRPVRRRTKNDNASRTETNEIWSPRKTRRDNATNQNVAAEFVLDTEQTKEEETNDDEPSLMFFDANARLIRSMKRCERRLPPMLNDWAMVDCVLTKHEVVYFDATDIDDDVLDDGDQTSSAAAAAADLRRKKKTVRNAIVATKGGKGLRLRDVAVGRKVVGHLELADVSSVKVERFPPTCSDSCDCPDKDKAKDGRRREEYWSRSDRIEDNRQGENWKHIMEDRLKITSTQGSLYLRFFSDLAEWTGDKQEDSVIAKNDTLLWCQTIVRLCGPEQLSAMKLPHFGEEGSAELLDYIEFVNRDTMDDMKTNTRKIHRRIRSRVSLPQVLVLSDAATGERASTNSATGRKGTKAGSLLSLRNPSVTSNTSMGDVGLPV